MKLHYWQSKNGVRNFGDAVPPGPWPRLFPGAFDDYATTSSLPGIGTLLNDRLPSLDDCVWERGGVFRAPPRCQNWHILRSGTWSAEALGDYRRGPSRTRRSWPGDSSRRTAGPSTWPTCRTGRTPAPTGQYAGSRVGLRYLDPRVAGGGGGRWNPGLPDGHRRSDARRHHGRRPARALDSRRHAPGHSQFKWRYWCASVGSEYWLVASPRSGRRPSKAARDPASGGASRAS